MSRDVGPVVAEKEAASLSAPALPDLPSTVAFLSGRPWAVGLAVTAWASSGLVVALVLGRRGHDTRTLGVLGIIFGPFLFGIARANLIPRESTVAPVEVDPGAAAGEGVHVLVAVLSSPEDVADVLPLLATLGTDVGEVTLVRPISFESAEDRVWDDEKADAARALSDAAVFLPDVRPRLLLVPGRGDRAIADFLRRHHADVAVAVGNPTDLAVVCRHLGERQTALVISAVGKGASELSRR